MTLEEPRRLRDEDDASSAELRAELQSFAAKRPSPEALARMAAALGVPAAPRVEPAPGAGSPAPSPLAKALLAGGGAAIGIAALIAAFRPTTESRPSMNSVATASARMGERSQVVEAPPHGSASSRTRGGVVQPGTPVESASASAPVIAPSVAPPPVVGATPPSVGTTPVKAIEPQAPVATPHAAAPVESPAQPRGKPDERRPAAASPANPPAAERSTETELLRDARLVLDSNPQIALSLAEQHRRDYPGGKFSQERELIAITALVRLGRSGAAAERAARFRESYPHSPYAASVDRLVPP